MSVCVSPFSSSLFLDANSFVHLFILEQYEMQLANTVFEWRICGVCQMCNDTLMSTLCYWSHLDECTLFRRKMAWKLELLNEKKKFLRTAKNEKWFDFDVCVCVPYASLSFFFLSFFLSIIQQTKCQPIWFALIWFAK